MNIGMVVGVIVFKDTGPNGQFGYSVALRDENDRQDIIGWTKEAHDAQILADSFATSHDVYPPVIVLDSITEEGRKAYINNSIESNPLRCPYCSSQLVQEQDEDTGDPFCRPMECGSCLSTWTEFYNLVSVV